MVSITAETLFGATGFQGRRAPQWSFQSVGGGKEVRRQGKNISIFENAVANMAPIPPSTLDSRAGGVKADGAHADRAERGGPGRAGSRGGAAGVWERFDLVIHRRDPCDPPLQTLPAFGPSTAFHHRTARLPGYRVEGLGTVVFNG